MFKKLLFAAILFIPTLGLAQQGTVLIIDKLHPKNDAFPHLVDGVHVGVSTDNFSGNLSSSDTNLQEALETLDALSGVTLSTEVVTVPGVDFTQGDLIYYNGSNWVVLSTATHTEGQVLTLSSGVPVWDDAPGAGSGEENTASNVGDGDGQVFKQKSSLDLEFRTLAAGDNVTIETHTSTVTISTSDDIELSTVTALTAFILDYLKDEGCIGTDADGKIVVSAECGDNLGNHLATQFLDMDGFQIVDISSIGFRDSTSAFTRVHLPFSANTVYSGAPTLFEINVDVQHPAAGNISGMRVVNNEGSFASGVQFSDGILIKWPGSNANAFRVDSGRVHLSSASAVLLPNTVALGSTFANGDLNDKYLTTTVGSQGNHVTFNDWKFLLVTTGTTGGYTSETSTKTLALVFDEDFFSSELLSDTTAFITFTGSAGGGGDGSPLTVWDSGSSVDTNVSTINFTTNLGSTQSSSGNVAAFLEDEITLSTVNANYVQSDLFKSITNQAGGEAGYQSLITDVVGLGHPGVKVMSVFHDPFGGGASEQASFYFTDSSGEVLGSGWTLGNVQFPSEGHPIGAGAVFKSTSSARFANTGNSSYVDIAAPGTITSSHTIRLPPSLGSVGHGLVIDSVSGRDVFLKYDAVGGSGETNTASNIGDGDGEVFAQKDGSDLEFRTLAAGSNVTIETHTSSVTISASGSGGSGDNLGNHTATETLKMDGFDIVDVSTIAVNHSSITILNAGDSARTIYYDDMTHHGQAVLESFYVNDNTYSGGAHTESFRTALARHTVGPGSPEYIIYTRYGNDELRPRVGISATGGTNWTLLNDDDYSEISFMGSFSGGFFSNRRGYIGYDETGGQGNRFMRLSPGSTNTQDRTVIIGNGSTVLGNGVIYRLVFDGDDADGEFEWNPNTNNFDTSNDWVFSSSVTASTMVVTNLARLDYLQSKDCIGTDASGNIIDGTCSGGSGETNTASNIGSAEGEVFAQKDGADLEFRTLSGGDNVTIETHTSSITISASGVGGSGDNLGNHTATETLKMDGFDISTVGKIDYVNAVSTMSGTTNAINDYYHENGGENIITHRSWFNRLGTHHVGYRIRSMHTGATNTLGRIVVDVGNSAGTIIPAFGAHNIGGAGDFAVFGDGATLSFYASPFNTQRSFIRNDGSNMIIEPRSAAGQNPVLRIGTGISGINYGLLFDGNTNDGSFIWHNSNNRFETSNDWVYSSSVTASTMVATNLVRLDYLTSKDCIGTDSSGNIVEGTCGDGGGEGGGGGYDVEPATVTFQLDLGYSASTGTVSTFTVTNQAVLPANTTVDSQGICLEDGTNCQTREEIIGTFDVTVPISAASLAPTVTNGFTGGVQTGETATNKVNFDYIALSSHTTNYFQFSYSMPEGWDGSTVTFKAVWMYSGGFQTEGVVFALQGLCRSNGNDLDEAYGSPATVSDIAFITSSDIHITDSSGALTLGGSCQPGDYVVWRGYRDYEHASDTLEGDVRLLELRIHFTRNNISD